MSYSFGEYPVYVSGLSVGSVTVSGSGLMTVFDCACQPKSREILRLAAACGGKYVTLGVPVPEGDVLRLRKSFTKNALAALGYRDADAFYLIRAGDAADVLFPAAPPAPDFEPLPALPVTESAAGSATEEQDDASQVLPITPPVPEPKAPEGPLEAPIRTDNAPGTLSEAAPDVSEAADAEASDGWEPAGDPSLLFGDPALAEACRGMTGALYSVRDGLGLLAVPVSPEEPFPLMPAFCFGTPATFRGREYIVFRLRDGNLTL